MSEVMNEAMDDKDQQLDAKALALRRLSVREYGSGEMLAYLKRKGAPEGEASRVVEELVTKKLIDDERYARVIARHQAFRDKGPDYVMMKLRQKGVSLPRRKIQEIFEETLPETVGSELEMARRVIERRYPAAIKKSGDPGDSKDPREKARAYAALVRRGFSRDVIRRALEDS